MVKVTFNNKPAQGKTAPVSPNKKTGGGVSIAFPNGIKKQGFIQTTPYQKALDEAILKASAADRRASSPMFRQQENVVTPDVQSAIMQGLMQDALQQQSAKKYQSPEAMKKAAEEPKKQTLGERVGNTLKGAAKTYGAGLANIAGERQIGANMQQRADMEKEIALWDQDIAAQKSVLSDPSATESERETARTVIETLEARKAAYRQAYDEGGVADQAANEIYKAADKMADSGARNIEKAKSGLGKVGQLAVDAGVAGAQMGADAAASALTGGVALIPMFIRGAGSSAQEARRQGATHEQQVRYGTLSGALSVATEKIGNAATPFKKMFGKGFLDNVIERSVKGLNNSAAGKLVLSFLEEGGEEVLEDLVQPALQTIYNGRTVGGSYSELEAAEVLNDFLVGGILGGLGGGVDAIRNRGYYDSHTEMPKIEGTKPNTTAAQEKTATPETTAPAAQRQAEPTVEQQQAQQNTTQEPAPTVGQQNTMPAQPAATPESAQGMGGGNLTPTQPNAAQGAAEGKADALDAGKRSVNAFQFDHPELHSYYADAAAVLQEEMSFAQKGGELIRRTSREAGDDEYIRTKRGVSERITRLLDDEGVRYDDIDRSLSAIIHNHGQENFAAAKRVELLLDDMLTNGYTDIHGRHIAPNEEYIAAKKAIPGADMSERTHEELPIYDMPEGRNGGIDNAGQETRNDAAGAELADAAERGTPGEANAARALSDGAAERGERRGNGRESERIPREVRNVGGEDGNAITVQQRLAASGISQFISPREANVPNGASGDNTVTIFDEADWDQELIGAADWAKSKGVKKVTALLGVIKVEKDGKTGRIFGAFNADTGEIFVNAGSVQRSVSETIEHETAHYLAEVARRENVRTFMRDVQSRYSSEEWGKVYDAYFDRYAALTGDYAGMSESDIELYVWEEIMGDAYAEIDQYDEKASRFNREAESALSQSGQESESALHGERTLGAVEQGRETAAATERRRGPPEKYSYAGRNAESADLDALHEAERYESRDEFKGTKALDELGVKIANSAGIYHNAEQLIANDKAAKSIQNATKRAEQRLGATRQEKTIARDIANGERSMADIPRSVKKSRVLELVDYYTAQKATKTGLLQQQRIEINDALREQARELIGTEAPEINRKGLRKLFDPSKGLVLYHRTPQRIMRALFGWKQGQQINEAVFEPVYENEQERKRFINRMFDEVRTFEGADGKKSALNKDESAFAQRLKEGRTVEELVEKSGAAESIRAAAENLKNGAEMKDAAREFSLDKGSRDLARQYADWLQTQDDYAAAKNVDRTKVENAIEKYTELYDKLYAAINDFLVAHGYEPIGFIKGYAPHFQTSEANGKLESALKAIGVDLGSGVGKLPTSIAGLTKSFKPNKRYNPFFQHRRGNETDYDIVKGFETYVDYASDVLYHTDDIMRVRQMANYLRSTFAPEEMKADIDQMEAMRYAPADVKEEYLRDKKKITGDTFLSYEDLTNLMEQYTDEKYRSIADATEFSDLVSWLDDYANKLAGKQLFEDRAMEREVGREALDGAKKLNRMFARANVAGNLSSALNQTAQLPMIATELGQKYTWRAVGDILRGKTTGMSAFHGESDFLTEKSGIDYIQSTKGEKAIEKLFSPLEKVDTLVSTIAVRGKYRMELDAGKSPKEAMKAADRWARDIMGTRSKGSAPLTFQSKNLIAQMLNMFQVEAANTFEHVTQDRLGPGFKEMAAKIGKDKAQKKLASDAIAYMLLAFLLNRLDEDAYGGTPVPFDVLGMGLNAAASANGLTSSDMLKMITDDVTENFFGERLFDTDPNDKNDELDLWSAAEDTLYNISNDVPYVRNVAGLLGLGDETLPMPDVWGTLTGMGKALKKKKNGKFNSSGEFWSEVGRQLMGFAGDTLPGGRQLEKTAQGIEALARGGSYQGTGGSKRLQYPVEPLLEDPFEALRAGLFGKNSLNESRAYWAAGGNALSVSQTTLYQELVDSGMSRKKAYETIRGFNDATADLEADKDENGNPVSGSKKEKVVEAINKLPLSRKQKNLLYLSRGYSEKDLNSLPWN